VGGACGTHGRGEKRVQGLVGRPEGKSVVGRPRLRWENGIKIDFRDIGWEVWSGFTSLRIGTGGELL
jgi:hypothetical protein